MYPIADHYRAQMFGVAKYEPFQTLGTNERFDLVFPTRKIGFDPARVSNCVLELSRRPRRIKDAAYLELTVEFLLSRLLQPQRLFGILVRRQITRAFPRCFR